MLGEAVQAGAEFVIDGLEIVAQCLIGMRLSHCSSAGGSRSAWF